MLEAVLICSDPECTESFDARAMTLGELEALACECGCALALVSVSEVDGEDARVRFELEPAY